MPEFHVSWHIDIDADNSTDAAEKAREIQLRQDSTATCFEVETCDNRGHWSKPDIIDLGAQPKTFSVLLLYPDYLAENYGQETFYEAVEANTSSEAVLALQKRLGAAHETNPDDFFCLLCIEGRHSDINPTL